MTMADPIAGAEAAEAAGLRYVSDAEPGIRRRRSGRGFTYLDPNGRTVRDPRTLARIRALAIPPAYTDVWICPAANGHIQATGRDARGRKQYRYHPRWRATRDETKFGRMATFAKALPKIRARVRRDLARPGLPRAKVVAAIVQLLESTGIRVGNDEYVRQNGSFGLTTLRDQHVRIQGPTLRFAFRGKSGKRHTCDLTDRRLARIVQRCQALPGEELFQYLDDDGTQQAIGSADVNDYLREITGEDFTAKDFRTWTGTTLAVNALRELGAPDSARAAKTNVIQAIDLVAERLNNTRAVCRKYYVHPTVFDTYVAGKLEAVVTSSRRNGTGRGRLHADELAVVQLLTAAG